MPIERPPSLRAVWRIPPLAVLCIVIVIVYHDPYTFYENASDLRRYGPWWQIGAGLLDLALLIIAAWHIVRGDLPATVAVLSLGAVYSLGLGVIYVERDGVSRFVGGVGGEQFLTVYLLAIGLRVFLVTAFSLFLWRARLPGNA